MNDKQRKDWQSQWNRQLDIAVRGEIGAMRRFYVGQYDKAIADFLEFGKTRNFFDIFRFNDFVDIYVQLYRRVGLRFAKWSFKELEKRQTKNVSISDRENVWDETFAAMGNQVGRSRIVSVQGTALETIEKLLLRFSKDPEFMGLGVEQKARIIRKKVQSVSQYQAERIIRTETIMVANAATIQSGDDFFGKNNYDKIWNHGGTRDPRPTHIALDGTKIPADQKFNVGGELMSHAGEYTASAANVINCGCSVTIVEREEKLIDSQLAIALAGLVVESEINEN